jgi:hypothetical protein
MVSQRFELGRTGGGSNLVGRGDQGGNDDNNERRIVGGSAGSGTFVPSLLGSSNPRVLSDMGLAIPRPTRLLPALAGLGDPRSLETEAEFKSVSLGVRLTIKHNINVAAFFST